MSKKRYINDAVEDLNARINVQRKKLKQVLAEKESIQVQIDKLRRNLEIKGTGNKASICSGLSGYEKRYAKLVNREEKYQAQIGIIEKQQGMICDNHLPLAGNAQPVSGNILTEAVFSLAERMNEQRLAEHASYRFASSIADIVQKASRPSARVSDSYPRFVELHGIASSVHPTQTPYTKNQAACWDICIYLTEGGADLPIWHRSELGALCITEKNGQYSIAVDADSFGSQFEMDIITDQSVRGNQLPYDIQGQLGEALCPSSIYHIVERGIFSGTELFIQGEIYIEKGGVHIRRTFDRNHTPIVTTKTQLEITRPRRNRMIVSAIIATVLVVFAIIIILSGLSR